MYLTQLKTTKVEAWLRVISVSSDNVYIKYHLATMGHTDTTVSSSVEITV